MNNKGSILFVDDEASIGLSFSRAFEYLGYSTDVCFSGKEAIKLLESEQYDVIVTDLKMPDVGGISVLEEAKKRLPDCIVIILTGFGDMGSAIDALRIGADNYMQKPCDIDDLTHTIEELLLKKKKEKQKIEEATVQNKQQTIMSVANGISHDFNNILAQIVGAIDLSSSSASHDRETAEFLNWARTGCTEAKKLTDKFLELSDMYSPRKWAVSVNTLIDNVIDELEDADTERIEVIVPEKIGDLYVDDIKIGYSLLAILTNAIEALQNPEDVITVTAENIASKPNDLPLQENDYIKITVKDTGKGIAQEHLSKIIDPYFSTKERSSIKGMGMGLTLASNFIRKNGGQLTIKSEVNKGTMVDIFLPGGPSQIVGKEESAA